MYVGGLPYGVREKDLERFFKGYGRIRDVLIKNGYGFCVSTNSVVMFWKVSLLLWEAACIKPSVIVSVSLIHCFIIGGCNDEVYLSGLNCVADMFPTC